MHIAQWKEDTDTMYKLEKTDTSKTNRLTTQEIAYITLNGKRTLAPTLAMTK
jgi:hypothetical protein